MSLRAFVDAVRRVCSRPVVRTAAPPVGRGAEASARPLPPIGARRVPDDAPPLVFASPEEEEAEVRAARARREAERAARSAERRRREAAVQARLAAEAEAEALRRANAVRSSDPRRPF